MKFDFFMDELGQKMEYLIGILVILFIAIAIRFEFNKSLYGTRWPILHLFKRLMEKSTRQKTLKDLLFAFIFVVLTVLGGWLILLGMKITQSP